MLQTYIPFLPKGAEPINNHIAIYHHDEKIEFFTASGPIYSCLDQDKDVIGFSYVDGHVRPYNGRKHTTATL